MRKLQKTHFYQSFYGRDGSRLLFSVTGIPFAGENLGFFLDSNKPISLIRNISRDLVKDIKRSNQILV